MKWLSSLPTKLLNAGQSHNRAAGYTPPPLRPDALTSRNGCCIRPKAIRCWRCWCLLAYCRMRCQLPALVGGQRGLCEVPAAAERLLGGKSNQSRLHALVAAAAAALCTSGTQEFVIRRLCGLKDSTKLE